MSCGNNSSIPPPPVEEVEAGPEAVAEAAASTPLSSSSLTDSPMLDDSTPRLSSVHELEERHTENVRRSYAPVQFVPR